MSVYMFQDYMYEVMIENDESWFVFSKGKASLIYDLPIYDS